MHNIDLYVQDRFIRMRLTNIRKSHGLTQKQLSEISGLSTATISSIEKGDNTCNLSSSIRYVEALGYEINIDKKVERDDTEGSDQVLSSTST